MRFVAAVACLLSPATSALAERFVLTIGNSGYEHVQTLPNPTNDARDIGIAFEELGYDVSYATDLTRSQMLDTLRDFRQRTLGAEQAIIYYAGHGIEVESRNFMIPVDARLQSAFDVEYETVSMDLLVGAVDGASGLRLVILDACRDNPFSARMVSASAARSIGRGLALYEPPGNSLVAYSAREGTVALDGNGQNSPYAEAFLQALGQPNLEIGRFFREVRDDVIRATGGTQEPFLYGSLSAAELYFHEDRARAMPDPAASSGGVPGVAELARVIELEFWRTVRDSGQAADFEDYLDRYPDGEFAGIALRRLAALDPAAARQASGAASGPSDEAPDVTAGASAGGTSPSEPLALTRAEIVEVQERLNILGFRAGAEDGLVGPRTDRAVTAFRQDIGLDPVARIDPAFMDAILAAVTDGQLADHRAERRRQREERARVAAEIAAAEAAAAAEREAQEAADDRSFLDRLFGPTARSQAGRPRTTSDEGDGHGPDDAEPPADSGDWGVDVTVTGVLELD